MHYNDIIITNMLFNSVTKINTGYIILDAIYIMVISSLVFYVFQSNFKNNVSRKIESYISYFDKTNKLIFSTTDKITSKRFKSIMHFVSKSNDPSVKTLTEIIDLKYSQRYDEMQESKVSIYRVDQSMKFNIIENIEGKVYYKEKEKEKSEYNGKIIYSEITYLEIFSKKFTLTQLEDWVEEKTKEYDNYLRSKSCDKQLLVDVCWNPSTKEIDIYNNPWISNVTFENRFFTDKENILNKINFFINNPDWYKKRGIPYTLGFLLWGEPGCGKTGFIKAIMNLTNRHGISIKLNNKFDMNKLRDIIYDDEISDDLIIPQKDRILIFEDIDCMGDIVKDRNIKDKDKNDEEEKDKYKEKEKEYNSKIEFLQNKIKKIKNDVKIFNNNELDDYCMFGDNNYNNNLSYFLNILDGLQECPGRIIIMTTNKPEQLDKALIRPGRIDYNINFTKATNEDIKNILEFYWDEEAIDILSNIYINIDINNKFSHAEIVNLCRTSETIEESIEKLIKYKPNEPSLSPKSQSTNNNEINIIDCINNELGDNN